MGIPGSTAMLTAGKQWHVCQSVCLSVFVSTAPQYFRPIPAQYIPGGGAVYWPSPPQMYPSMPFIPQARPGGVGPVYIPPSHGAYPVYMASQPSPTLSPAHRGQPQPAMFLGPAPGAVGQYFTAQGSPGVVQLGKVWSRGGTGVERASAFGALDSDSM